jgi:hypothetical protein
MNASRRSTRAAFPARPGARSGIAGALRDLRRRPRARLWRDVDVDADAAFAIMSVAKPFVFALVSRTFGPEETRRRAEVNATGCRSTPWRAVAVRVRARHARV